MLNFSKNNMYQNNQFLSVIKQNIGIITLAGILVGSLSFFFLVLNEKGFKVQNDFLIVQNQNEGQDYYTLSKSAEYLGNVLGESVYSELFIDEVVNTGKVSNSFLSLNKKERMKEWSKMVKVTRNPQLGMIGIAVLNDNQKTASNVSDGIGEVLTKKNYLFRGNGQDIEVRILTGPIVEKNPSFTNLFLVIVGGFLMGAILSIFWLYYRNERDSENLIGGIPYSR
mgnify:CR=1 FL=1